MFMYPVDDEIVLALPRPVLDAPRLFGLIQADRAGIGRYLPWAEHLADVAAEQAFLNMTLQHFGSGLSVNLVIWYKNEPVGMISFNGFQQEAASTDIGYWLGEQFRGRGIMHRALLAMCELAFTEYGVNKVIVRAATDNLASNHVAAAAGFKQDGVLRAGVRLSDGYHDEVEWSLLKRDYAVSHQ